MNNYSSIYDFLDSKSLRKGPAMYLGKKSVTYLRMMMIGYEICEEINSIKKLIPFLLFGCLCIS